MKMKPEEITAIIKQQIQDYDVDLNVDDVGTVLDIGGDGIAIFMVLKEPWPVSCWNYLTVFMAWF